MRNTIFLLISVISFNTCTNLFSTREGEVEDPIFSSNFYDEADDPDAVALNFIRSIKDKNPTEYLKLFSNPTSDDEESKPYKFNGAGNFSEQSAISEWGYDQEEKFAQTFLTNNSITELEFDADFSGSFLLGDELTETGFIIYSLTVTKNYSSIEHYSGQMQLKLYRSSTDNLIWYIYEWTDEAVGDAPTISILKNDIYSRIQ